MLPNIDEITSNPQPISQSDSSSQISSPRGQNSVTLSVHDLIPLQQNTPSSSSSPGSAELWGFSAAGSSGTQRTNGQSGHRMAADSSQKDISSNGHSEKSQTSIKHLQQTTPPPYGHPRLRSGEKPIRKKGEQRRKQPHRAKNRDRRANLGETPSPPQNRRAAKHAAEESGLAGGTRGRGVRQARQAAIRCAPVGLPAYQPTTPPHLPARLNLRRILHLLIHQQMKDQAEKGDQD